MTSIAISTITAIAVLSLLYILKRKFWPVDAPPKIEESDDETQIDNKIQGE